MADTIEVHVPRVEVADELTAALADHGFDAQLVDDGDVLALQVSYATTEQDRLAKDAAHAIEAWIAERDLPLIVQRANGGVAVRPPGD